MAAGLLSSRYNYIYILSYLSFGGAHAALTLHETYHPPVAKHAIWNVADQTLPQKGNRNRRADSKHKVSTKHIVTLLFFRNPLAMQPSTLQAPNNNTRIESWQIIPPPRSPPALPVSNPFHPRQRQQQQSSKSRRRRLALHVNMISTKSKRPAASISTISESDPGGSESVLPSITYWKHVHRQDTSEARGQEPGTGAVVNDFVHESGYVMRG